MALNQQQGTLWFTLRHLVAAAALVALGATIYSGTYEHPFAFDDNNAIKDNSHVWMSDFSTSKLYDAAYKSRDDGRRPVAFASYALNYYFGDGLKPYGFHVVNTIIHCLNGVLVYCFAFLTFTLLGRSQAPESDNKKRKSTEVPFDTTFWMSLFAAALFVAHPIQTQGVTYIVQRMTSMATLFYLLTLVLYILGRQREQGWGRILLWIGAVASFALSWGSKRIGFPIFIVIPLYEWYFFQNMSLAWFKRREVKIALIVAPLVALAIAAVAMARYEEGKEVVWNPMARLTNGYAGRDFTMADRLYTQPAVVMYYLYLTAYPSPGKLNLLHDFPTYRTLFNASTLLSLAAIFGMIGAAIVYARRQPLLSFAVLWFFLHLALESTILPLEMVYEHRVYLPLVGVALGVAYALWTLLLANQKALAGMISCTLIAVLSYAAVERNAQWANIYDDILAKNPNSARALLGRGLGYLKEYEKRRDNAILRKAVTDFENLMAIYPDAKKHIPGREPILMHMVIEARVARAEALGVLKLTDEARKAYDEVIEISPDHAKTYTSRGNFHVRENQLALAADDYSRAIELWKEHSDVEPGQPGRRLRPAEDGYHTRGSCYLQMGQLSKAIDDLSKAIAYDPKHYLARVKRGQAYARTEQPMAAIADFDEAIKIYPNDVTATLYRSQLFQQLGRDREAEQGYRKILQRNPKDLPAAMNLARLLANSRDAAVRNPREAMKLAASGCDRTDFKSHAWLGTLAEAAIASGRPTDAIQAMKRAIQVAPQRLKAAYQERLEQLERAIRERRKAS